MAGGTKQRSTKYGRVQWYWQWEELSEKAQRQAREVVGDPRPQELYLNTASSMDSEIDVTTVIGACQVSGEILCQRFLEVIPIVV